MEKQQDQQNRQTGEPTIAPGMDTHNSLEEEATENEIKKDDYTEVTRLYLDRTPDD